MATQVTSPKIEELRFKIKTDPKSRLFYQLAEELRKVKAYEEAEQVLRTGLATHPTYLAAWVTLGRSLREQNKHTESIEAFNKALQTDPGNVVAARLMADAFLDLGDKIEAIKKYKLVRALLPVDEELNAIIDKLEDELNPVTIHPAPAAEPAAAAPAPVPAPAAEVPIELPLHLTSQAPFGETTTPPAPEPLHRDSPFMADDTMPQPTREQPIAIATADVEPMHVEHEQSPFEDPAPVFSAAAMEIEQPAGMHIEPAPLVAEVPAPWPDEEPAADVFEPADSPSATAADDDIANTMTMADLYVQQGHLDRAQSIYESILDRDPNNDVARAKLDALESRSQPQPVASAPQRNQQDEKREKLERWLAKVKSAEERRV